MCIAIICFLVCDAINFQINLISLMKAYPYITKKSRQKEKENENERTKTKRAFKVK